MTIATETRILIHAALEGDPALASLAVAGSTPDKLSVHIAPGVPAKSIGGSSHSPAPPFRRETLTELVLRMQRLRWRRVQAVTRMVLPPEEEDLQALRIKHARAKVSFECWPGWTDMFDAVFTWLVSEPDQGKVRNPSLLLAWRPAPAR